jgi:hypothetical protein
LVGNHITDLAVLKDSFQIAQNNNSDRRLFRNAFHMSGVDIKVFIQLSLLDHYFITGINFEEYNRISKKSIAGIPVNKRKKIIMAMLRVRTRIQLGGYLDRESGSGFRKAKLAHKKGKKLR